jgi:PilZ domain
MTSAEPRTKMQRELRRQLHNRLAWITLDDGITMHECHVLDVSSGGARIATDDAMDVRDRFELTLVRGHQKRELCEVVWRRGRTYGVKFVAPPQDGTPPANDPTTASSPLS